MKTYRFIRQLIFFIKRNLRKPVFVLLLCLLPLFTVFLTKMHKDAPEQIRLALYTDNMETDAGRIITKLLEKEGMFSFILCDSSPELYRKVATGNAECGYLFPADLFKKLDQNKKNSLIQVVTAPSTVLNKVTDEIVFSELFEEYSLHLLKNYLIADSPLKKEDSTMLLRETEILYRKHMADGSAFSFTYQGGGDGTVAGSGSVLLFPLRGMISVIVLLSSFCGMLNYYTDLENSVFTQIKPLEKVFMRFLSISVPVLLTTLTGLMCILSSEISVEPSFEALAMAGYALGVITLSMLFLRLSDNKLLLIPAIPILTLGSLILTPVFIDITLFFPALEPLCRIFVPYYYLNLF